MSIPFVIDNVRHRLSDALKEPARSECRQAARHRHGLLLDLRLSPRQGRPASARGLPAAARLRAADGGGRRAEAEGDSRLKARLRGDLEAEPYTPETLKLVEELIAFLHADKVQVRLYDKGFLHAKAYLFHQDKVGPHNAADRLRPFAAIVGSSNFTGPGLVGNRELNLVHRVILPDEDAARPRGGRRSSATWTTDRDRSRCSTRRAVDVPDDARRFIKSEVGARAITDLMRWYERQWADSVDFKDDLIELLDASKFGTKEYTPYEVYTKALYEYFKEELGENAPGAGPQRRGPGRVPGGCRQEGPPHPGPLRRRADRRFRGPGQDLDRQEAARRLRLPPPPEGRRRLPGVAAGDVAAGAGHAPPSPPRSSAWRSWAGDTFDAVALRRRRRDPRSTRSTISATTRPTATWPSTR